MEDGTTGAVANSETEDRKARNVKRLINLGVMVGIVLAVGCLVGVICEGWRPVTALYVVVQIATTVGYGDFTVETSYMKVFMSLYVLVCLLVLAYVMNLATGSILETQMNLFRRRLREFERKIHGTVTVREREEINPLLAATSHFLGVILVGTVFFALYEPCTCSYGASHVDGCVELPYDKCVQTGGYVKTWGTSLYMSVITMTTVGFGDHTPRTRTGRIFACFWMMCGCAFTANWIGALTKEMFERRSEQDHEDNQEEGSVFNKALFEQMDKDNNGKLSRAEFRAYQLVKHGIVTQEDLDRLDRQYDRLDTNHSGTLTYEECEGNHIKPGR